MRSLATMIRPQVIFDPSNKDHRKWVADFINIRSWRNCPVRFIVDDNSLELVNVIQRQLVQYYVNQEFTN
jgi:hypothetical protein